MALETPSLTSQGRGERADWRSLVHPIFTKQLFPTRYC